MRIATLLILTALVCWSSVAYGDLPPTTNRMDLEALQAAKDELVNGKPTGVNRGATGDNMADPIWIEELPYSTTGNTCQYAHDYDEVCPYTGSLSPDVVYAIAVPTNVEIRIDLCGSLYDTKVYVYDAAGALVACNDDYYFDAPCGTYVSCIPCLPLAADVTYYIVIDGYGSDCGDYTLTLGDCVTCAECPEDGILEAEPECYDWYLKPDVWNGGCNSEPPVFQVLEPECDGTVVVCGWGGTDPNAMGTRDTDWYEITVPAATTLNICCEAEIPVNCFLLAPPCEEVAQLGQMLDIGCDVQCMQVLVEAGTYWVWVGPNGYTGIPCGRYVLTIEGYYPPGGPSATESKSWGSVKSLYR